MHRLLLLAILPALTACTGAELAIVGAASAGLSTGQEISRTGKVRVAVMKTGEEVLAAVDAACDELKLKIYEREQVDDYEWNVHASDRKHTLRINVEELTPNLSVVEVNVGLLGSGAEGELLLNRIVAQLREDGGLAEADT